MLGHDAHKYSFGLTQHNDVCQMARDREHRVDAFMLRLQVIMCVPDEGKLFLRPRLLVALRRVGSLVLDMFRMPTR